MKPVKKESFSLQEWDSDDDSVHHLLPSHSSVSSTTGYNQTIFKSAAVTLRGRGLCVSSTKNCISLKEEAEKIMV